MSMTTRIESYHERTEAVGYSHQGARDENEDVMIIESAHSLYGVLDGMGGAAAGGRAAKVAADTIVAFITEHAPCTTLSPREMLELAIGAAAAGVFIESKRDADLDGMGTTVVACLIAADRLIVGHVGDSRAYRWRRGELLLLTHDHSVVQELVDAGLLTAADAATSRMKHRITRNLGSDANVPVEIVEHELEPGDRVLLCSDGLHDVVSHEEIARVLAASVFGAADQLIELALTTGTDNITVVVIEVTKVTSISARTDRQTRELPEVTCAHEEA